MAAPGSLPGVPSRGKDQQGWADRCAPSPAGPEGSTTGPHAHHRLPWVEAGLVANQWLNVAGLAVVVAERKAGTP